MRRSVLLVDLGAHFGGVENYLVNLAELLEGEMELYALCVLPDLAVRLAGKGVKVTRIPIFAGILKPLRFLVALVVLPYLLLVHRIDVVQLNGFLESVLGVPTRLLGRSAVYTRHGPFEMEQYSWWRNPLKFAPRKIAEMSIHLATHVVCVSEAVAESIRGLLPANRYSVISNWISKQRPFTAPRTDLEPSARVLCAGRLEQYKGLQLVIEAARVMPRVEVTIVGDGEYRGALEGMARDLPNVRFLGFQRNIPEFYKAADIFVMPSLGPEGLPMTSLEAMGCGLPCVFSDLPVHEEITDGGKGAYLFRCGDGASLLKGLQVLCGDAAVRSAYAAEAHRIIASRYTDERVRAAYLDVFAGG